MLYSRTAIKYVGLVTQTAYGGLIFLLISMLSKKRRQGYFKNVLKKAVLFFVLALLIWSRIIYAYSAINDVHASYTTDINAGHISLPVLEDQEQLYVQHVNIQKEASEMPTIRLEALSQAEIERKAKADRVRNFYAKWNAPMAAQADYIVEVSEAFGLDFRLIPSISIVESSGGHYCFRPYNAFGYGGMSFTSFEEAIYTVASGLANGYGASSDPYAIGISYNPSNAENWGAKVSGLMQSI